MLKKSYGLIKYQQQELKNINWTRISKKVGRIQKIHKETNKGKT